jgi:hypothetical protein
MDYNYSSFYPIIKTSFCSIFLLQESNGQDIYGQRPAEMSGPRSRPRAGKKLCAGLLASGGGGGRP